MAHRRGKTAPASKEQEPDDGRRAAPRSTEAFKKSSWDEPRLLIACIGFRLLNALFIQTFFNPDEYWQSVEVAHRAVFGYGHLTWEWKRGLRSYLHPLIFVGLYKFLALLGLDTRWLVVKAPRLMQGVFAAIGDYYLFKLTKHYWGEYAARWAVFCQIINWFSFFCMVRTFSNSLEMVLTLVALYYWVSKKKTFSLCSCHLTSRQVALFLAALACALRPTSAIVWLYVGLVGLFQTHNKLGLLLEVFVIGAIVLGATSLLDRWMYGEWTFVPLNFVKFNFLSSGGDYYGTHPWHWYFSQGFPAMLLTFLPVSLLGIWWSKQWDMAGLISWVLFLYSFLGHKEFRFVLPILPLAMMFAGYAIACMQQSCKTQVWQFASSTLQIKVSAQVKMSPKKASENHKRQTQQFWFHATVACLLATNLPMAFYMSAVHQRGSESVMHYLSSEVTSGHVKSVMFLMPCHSTPFYSFLHSNVSMRFLDCTPSDELGYVDEADRFFAEPEIFLFAMFQDVQGLPTHLVMFDSLERSISTFLNRSGYKLVKNIFHAHFAVDRGLQKSILVYISERSAIS